MKTINKKDISLALTFIVFGVLSRTILHVAPNLEFITAFALAAGYFMHNKKFALAVPLFSMIISDLIIGNTNIFLFTWSAFLITALIGVAASKFKSENLVRVALKAEGLGIISTIVFFIWTNFGVVVLGNMYAHDINGLIRSYVNALPFLRNQMIGNMIFTPLIFVAVKLVLEYKSVKKDNMSFKAIQKESTN